MKQTYLIRAILTPLFVLLIFLPAVADDFPLQLKEISSFYIPTTAIDVCGNYAYALSYDTFVYIIDISEPASPKLAGQIDYQNTASVAVSGNIACLDHNYSLSFWDISDISTPVFLSQFDLNATRCDDIKIVGHYVLASVMYAVKAIDFNDPLHPVEAGSVDTPGFATLLSIRGDLALVADLYNFTILDISDPRNMQVLSAILDPITCVDVDFYHDYAVYAAYSEQYNFIIADIHDPINPYIVSRIKIPGYVLYLSVVGNFAYVDLWSGGIAVVDISNPANPFVITRDSTVINNGFETSGNCIVTASGSLSIFTVSPNCSGIEGDANGDGQFNGLDVIYDVNYLKGIGYPVCPTYCIGYIDPVYREADANGNCQFNGIDITYGINYLKGGPPLPEICPDCPEK